MIQFKDVKFSKDPRFKPLTFSVEQPGIVGIYGPAKTGKTACLLAMIGGVRPVAGSITVLGLNPVKKQREIRQKVGLSFVEGVYEPYFSLSVFDNFKFQGALLGKKVTPVEVDRLLEKIEANFTKESIIADLNPLQRIKVGLALALLGEPPVVLIDEPFRNLTCLERKHIEKILVNLKQEGKLVIYTTLKEEELGIADTVVDVVQGGVSNEFLENCAGRAKTAS
ncbi:ATP-binding cassette domain-containing protein [Carboxydothermus ferrireducens]|uniref:ABC-type multidrug transport system ATPase subunit n=1 Tax=Carboxydothermus ferrireducens DSM 11255 TaxID=1119529 RepID=A0ABX2R662_9THEO|nr:ATP-binding cassette domain-containing protein [Carboxydothermus ferrireducens]NYE56390.1 ABC-type multidrug transport system ATPase subunit [Carboxydothermus ferrireducens DSM 11255]